MNKNKIQELIHDSILGIITPEDEILLQQWVAESDANHRLYDAILGKNDLAKRYAQYSKIDEKAAWEKFQTRHLASPPALPRREGAAGATSTPVNSPQLSLNSLSTKLKRFAAAAAVAVLIAGVAMVWFNKEEQKADAVAEIIERVELSPASEKAQTVARQSGRQIASMTIGGKVIEITTPEEYAEILEKAPIDETMELSTSSTHEYWMTLPDGTRVHLNNNTRLKYPAHFSGSQREVILSGMATFKVAKGNAPFIVATSDGVITDLGTEFFINTNAENGGTEVVLFSGKVKVDNGNGRETMMAPGEKAEFTSASQIKTSQADIPFYRAQSEGVFLFRNTTMRKMMTLIGHWYGVETEFARPELGDMTFTGSLDKYGSLQSILDAINSVTGLEVSNKGGKILIKD